MTAIIVLAAASAVAPWYGLTIGSPRADCVAVTLVDPRGPAALAGLRDDDCIAGINGERPVDADDLLKRLQATKPNVTTTLRTSDGRVFRVRPVRRSLALEESYCRFVASGRSVIKVFIVRDKNPAEEIIVTLPSPATVANVKEKLNVDMPLRAVLVDKCRPVPSTVSDDPEDAVVVPDGSVLYFGYDNIRLFQLRPKEGTTDAGPESRQ